MTQTEMQQLDTVQDDLVCAVMYAFAKADYGGADAVTIKAVQFSDILDGMSVDLVNEALLTAQQAGLVTWDERRVGAIRLTELGFRKYLLVRDDCFDDIRNRRLRHAVARIDPVALRDSECYRNIRKTCSGLAALPGQPCPQTGRWQARRPEHQYLFLREGDIIPFPAYDGDDRVTWYLVTGAGD
jgi:hypothetical protein